MCDEEKKKGNGRYELTAEEKLLLEEYKLGHDAYYRSESEYSKRENFFIVAEGIIVAAAVQAVREDLCWVAILISLFGIWLSAIWFFMQARSSGYSRARVVRLKEIEDVLPSKKDNFTIFAFEKRCEEIRKDKYLKGWYKKMSNWCLRKSIPLIFLILWMWILVVSLFDPLCFSFKLICIPWLIKSALIGIFIGILTVTTVLFPHILWTCIPVVPLLKLQCFLFKPLCFQWLIKSALIGIFIGILTVITVLFPIILYQWCQDPDCD